MKTRHIRYDLWVRKKLFVIDDVPAEVCVRCGETVFTPQVTENILSSIQSSKQHTRKVISVPILTLKHAV
jgi:YgiT-type zinc finger domain-containing protein